MVVVVVVDGARDVVVIGASDVVVLFASPESPSASPARAGAVRVRSISAASKLAKPGTAGASAVNVTRIGVSVVVMRSPSSIVIVGPAIVAQYWPAPAPGQLAASGEVLAHLARPAGIASAYASRFSRDGSQIYFRGTDEDGAEGMWSMPASGGDAILIVALDDPALTVFGTEVGPEEFYVAFAEYESDIWVMDLEW